MLLFCFLENKARQIFKRRMKRASRMENTVSGSHRSKVRGENGWGRSRGWWRGTGQHPPRHGTVPQHPARRAEQGQQVSKASQRSGSAQSKGKGLSPSRGAEVPDEATSKLALSTGSQTPVRTLIYRVSVFSFVPFLLKNTYVNTIQLAAPCPGKRFQQSYWTRFLSWRRKKDRKR